MDSPTSHFRSHFWSWSCGCGQWALKSYWHQLSWSCRQVCARRKWQNRELAEICCSQEFPNYLKWGRKRPKTPALSCLLKGRQMDNLLQGSVHRWFKKWLSKTSHSRNSMGATMYGKALQICFSDQIWSCALSPQLLKMFLYSVQKYWKPSWLQRRWYFSQMPKLWNQRWEKNLSLCLEEKHSINMAEKEL